MTGVLLALASALLYGVADVWGGLLSRRADFAAVALLGQIGGLACAVAAALAVPAPAVSAGDLAWGALSGAGTGLAMVFLYRGISKGNLSIVVPVSAVGGVALPVAVGVAFLGDRPTAAAWLGIAIVVPALWLVSRSRSDEGAGSARPSRTGSPRGPGSASSTWPSPRRETTPGSGPSRRDGSRPSSRSRR